jgi:adenylate cyclase, class 2
VVKERRIYLWENVRIHLDRVDGLGHYLEFEAVLSEDAGSDISQERVDYLTRVLGIRPQDTIAGSYSDLAGL